MDVVKIIIEYDGTNFFGWQRQKKLRTVQGELERVLKKIFKEVIEINGSGRTDAGVHAYGQVATFETNVPMPLKNLKIALNKNLASDVNIIDLSFKEKGFHARYSAVGKTYVYKVFNSQERNVFTSNYRYHYEYNLDYEAMVKASKLLLGTNDYSSFLASGSSVTNTVRTIEKIELVKENDFISFIYTGDGFLYKMIRIMTALLLEVGNNRISQEEVLETIKNPSRKYTSIVAPSKGLYLKEVYYK